MKYLLLPLLVGLAGQAAGQNPREQARQYEERKAANQRTEQRIHQQYLNNLPNQPGGTPGTSTAPDDAALRATLEKMFEVKPAPAPSTAAERAESQAASIRSHNEAVDNRRKEHRAARATYATYGAMADELQTAGFTYAEGFQMARYALGPTGKPASLLPMLEVAQARKALTAFNATYATASYEELVRLALTFRRASLSAVSALRRVELRFPAQREELDLLVLEVLPGFYTGAPDANTVVEQQTLRQIQYMRAMFEALLLQYPVQANQALWAVSGTIYDPYRYATLTKPQEQQLAAALRYILHNDTAAPRTLLPLPKVADPYYVAKARLYGCRQFFVTRPQLLKDISLSEWDQIAAAQGVPAYVLQIYLSK